MKCPACGKQMVEEDFGGVRVDVCRNGCHGIWFDWMELVQLDEKHEGAGQALQEALDTPFAPNENRGRIDCPKCGLPMFQHVYKRTHTVTVDECPKCAGFFLDAGELNVLRETYRNDAEDAAFVESITSLVPEYGAAQAELKQDAARIEQRRKALGKMGLLFRRRMI